MFIPVCKSKIHRVTVTQAELDYVGSITIDKELMEAANIGDYQYLNITNLDNGTPWRTYAIPGRRGNGDICLNGPPAHHFHPGHKIIILAEAFVEPREFESFISTIVFVDDKNHVTEIRHHENTMHPLS